MPIFDQQSVQRITATVHAVERGPKNTARIPAKPVGPVTDGFWAEIMTGADGKYSWRAVGFNDLEWENKATEWGEGDHTADNGYAVEAQWQSRYVLQGSKVFLQPAVTQDHYLFNYAPGGIIVVSTSVITAGTTGQLGSGTATVYITEPDGSYTSSVSTTVFNQAEFDIETTKILQCKYCSGLWLVDVELCE